MDMPKDQVEKLFGVFKEQFQIEKEVVIEMVKTEEKINLNALTYNIIRLHNLKQKIKNTVGYLGIFTKAHPLKIN